VEEKRIRKSVFEDVKVADFSRILAGPGITKFLADYGATVVRVEWPSQPDLLRLLLPFKDGKPGLNRSAFFAYFNANKYSIAINLTHPSGQELAKKLVAWADIVVENFAPGVMEQLSLGYEELKELKPDIIMVRSSNQGQTGPHSKHPGFGHHINALGGFLHFTGWPDREPSSLMPAYPDFFSPLFAVSVLIAALDHRRKTGRGQLIDISQLEVSLQFLAAPLLECEVNGAESSRMGNASPCAAPHGVYRCKGDNRWCAIAVFTEQEWQAFCRAIGNPAWIQHPKFATLSSRKKHEEELNRLVEAWTVNFTAEEVMSLMQEAGIAAGVVQNGRDVYLDPQLKYRQAFWVLPHKVIGPFSHLGQTSWLSKTPAKPRMPAPCLGEHTGYVCKQLLGMSEGEINKLVADGAILLGGELG